MNYKAFLVLSLWVILDTTYKLGQKCDAKYKHDYNTTLALAIAVRKDVCKAIGSWFKW